jgi:hypothetical protein
MQIIELTKKDAPIFEYEKCIKCGQKFTLNRFMIHHGLFSFHLTCFKKFSEKKIEEFEENIKEMKNDIERLKRYNKEMVCETLLKEKYG